MQQSDGGVRLHAFSFPVKPLILNAEIPIISHFRDIFSNASNTLDPN